MNAKHTPGPWRVAWLPQQTTAEIETINQSNGEYRHITNDLPMCPSPDDPVETIDGRRYKAESCANARLIAAAPDLIDALQECITEDGALAWRNAQFAGQRLEAISRIARNAIAKATEAA